MSFIKYLGTQIDLIRRNGYFRKMLSTLYDRGRANLTASCSMMISIVISFSAQAQINCNQYKIPEFQDLCSSYLASQITVHESVLDNDLNTLRDSWHNNIGLHILPPGVYSVRYPLDLSIGQAILPNPVTPLTQNQLRTIQLTISTDEFTSDDIELYLLRLRPGGRAGGIEIHRSELQLPDGANFQSYSLVFIDTGGNGGLIGSYLTTQDDTSSLNQLIHLSSPVDRNPGSTESAPVTTMKTLLARNYLLVGGAQAGVVADLATDHQVTIKNCLIRTVKSGTAGVQVNNGDVRLTSSDMVMEDSCNANCQGVSLNQTQSHRIVQSTFWSPGSNTAIKQTQNNNASTSLGLFETNLFSRSLTLDLIAGDASNVSGSEFQSNHLKGTHSLIDPARFFDYTGELGVSLIPSLPLHQVCLAPHQTGLGNNLTDFQKMIHLNSSGFTLFDSFPPNDTCPEVRTIDRSQMFSYFIAAEILIGAGVITVANSLCYVCGRRSIVPIQTFSSQEILFVDN